MEVPDRLVDIIAEKVIERSKYNLVLDPAGLADEYRKQIGTIKQLFDATYYWHGTGRFHYQHMGPSKYHSGFSDQITDVLESIINSKGLLPQYDFWTQLSSISLSQHRMHARAYAQFHQYTGNSLKYEYGSPKFWYFTLVSKLAFTGNLGQNIYRVSKSSRRYDFRENLSRWAGYVKSEFNEKPLSIFNFYKLRSDIPDNYGILFGIGKSGIKEVSYHRQIERFEVRCISPITLKQFTHLEVPLNNLKETREFLKSRGIDLPVIAIELMEIYMNTIIFGDLVE